MKTIEKSFKVELSEKEVDTIVNALANECHNLYAEYKAGKGEVYPSLSAAREVRNGLAGLLNRCFMGED